MGFIDQVIAADSLAFTDPDLMPGVESVTITFNDQTTRTVYAQVFRDEPAPFGDGYRPSIQLAFRNHATLGLLPSEIDGGGVIAVAVAKNYGETAVPMTMRRMIDPEKRADAGMVWVEVG